MFRRLTLLFSLLLIKLGTYAQLSPKLKLWQYEIKDKKWGDIHFCVTSRDMDKRKPLLLYLDGSGDRPLFRFKIDSARRSSIMYSSIALNYDSLAAYYHIVFISKPGVKFVDSVFVPSLDSNVEFSTPSEYTKMLSAEWRAQTASGVVDYLINRLPVDKSKVVAVGYSEGAQVAPHVAVLNKKVTHVVCLVGNGLNQFYDFIIQERLRAVRGEVTEDEAQRNVDTLIMTFKDIYAAPASTDKEWAGHSYQRWASFCTKDPMDYLLDLNVPIYMAKGTADENTQILSTDYVALEFLRRGKRNLTYKTYPGCNHFFQKVTKEGKVEDKMDEVMGEMLGWLAR